MPLAAVKLFAERNPKAFYWKVVVPVQALLLTIFSAPMYGFNALIAPLNEIFTPNDPNSGWAGAVSGGIMLFGGGFGALLNNWLTRLMRGPERLLIVLNVGVIVVFALGALACQLKSGALLIFGFALPAGLIFSNLYAICVTQTMGWARKFNKAGLQSGVIGLAFGFWGAVYSFGGPPLADALGIEFALLLTGLLVMLVGLSGSLAFVVVPAPEKQEPETVKEEKPEDSELGFAQILRLKPFWLFSVFFLLFLAPGFGFKIIIQALSIEVFHATDLIASIMAVAFLVTYGFSRLIFGILSDKVSTKPLYLIFIATQCIALLVAAVTLPSMHSVVLFTVLMCFVGGMFAAGKCIWMVALLKIYGPVNFYRAVHLTMPAYGLAGFFGPFTLNYALKQTDIATATSLWLYVMSGALLLCLLLFKLIRRIDYQLVAAGKSQKLHLRAKDELDRF